MAHNDTKVVTRYAPSPTGFQHVGGIRTALFAWLWARKNNGTFILRIEDTDKNREVEGAIQHTIDALTWLGIEWDYGPDKPKEFGSCLQSDRLDIYKKYALQLVEKGLAYPDPYTEAEVEQFRNEAQTNGLPFLFRNHRPNTTEKWDGTKPLRFKVPEVKRYTWHDVVRGELTAGEEALDDFILIKADGYPTYNFAHIVDDLEMGVTHVMRGEEFISSTPKFLSLYDALEIKYPVFVTLPPIMGPDGKKKLSKRDGAKDLLDYKKDGYLPSAMCNFLALIGWNPGGDRELFLSQSELLEAFTLEKIQRSGGAFNEEKLKWMNKEHIAVLSDEQKVAYVSESISPLFENASQFSHERVVRMSATVLERVHNKTEIQASAEAGEYSWAFESPEYDTQLLKWKNDATVADVLPRLQKISELLQTADFENQETIKNSVWPYAETAGKGEVLSPLRIALSGKERSPDPFTLAFILGKEETLARVQAACDKISA